MGDCETIDTEPPFTALLSQLDDCPGLRSQRQQLVLQLKQMDSGFRAAEAHYAQAYTLVRQLEETIATCQEQWHNSSMQAAK